MLLSSGGAQMWDTQINGVKPLTMAVLVPCFTSQDWEEGQRKLAFTEIFCLNWDTLDLLFHCVLKNMSGSVRIMLNLLISVWSRFNTSAPPLTPSRRRSQVGTLGSAEIINYSGGSNLFSAVWKVGGFNTLLSHRKHPSFPPYPPLPSLLPPPPPSSSAECRDARTPLYSCSPVDQLKTCFGEIISWHLLLLNRCFCGFCL